MKFLKSFTVIICSIILIWMFASYIDVIADNTSPNPHHHNWNVFTIMIDRYEEGFNYV